MSSWIPDLDRSLLPLKKSAPMYITHCKLGREVITSDDETVWLRSPIGLSCVLCATKAGLVTIEITTSITPPVVAPPKPKKPPKLVHGTASAYKNHKCRCEPCTKANSRASSEYRARRKMENA